MEAGESLAEGRYLLSRELGSGGMATVFLAEDTRLDVRRAIKIIRPEYAASASLMRRFEREARVMAQLEHPHIVPVHDIGTEQGFTYIVMSLLVGGSLDDHLKRYGPMPANQACGVVMGVLEALDVAHEHGVVHRDIKPHNVLIDNIGRSRLTDFGIASEGRGPSLTRTGSVMGTWAYMAPEQRHSAKATDGRSDLYSVGAMLLTLLTATEPHELHSPDAREEQFDALPKPLTDFITTCTRFRPEQRYQSATEAKTALLAIRTLLPEDPETTPALGSGWAAPGELPPTSGPKETNETLLAFIDGTSDPSEAGPTAVPRDQGETTIVRDDRTELLQPVEMTAPASPPRASEPSVSRPRPPLLAMVGAGVVLVGLLAVGVWSLAPGAALGPRPATIEPTAEPLPEPGPASAVSPLPQPSPAAPPAAPTPTPAQPAPAPSPSPVPAPNPRPAPTEAGPETQPEPEAGKTGTLRIASRPAGTVFIDRVEVGMSPVTRTLPVGLHRIEIRVNGDTHSRKRTVEADTMNRWCWDFEEDGPC